MPRNSLDRIRDNSPTNQDILCEWMELPLGMGKKWVSEFFTRCKREWQTTHSFLYIGLSTSYCGSQKPHSAGFQRVQHICRKSPPVRNSVKFLICSSRCNGLRFAPIPNSGIYASLEQAYGKCACSVESPKGCAKRNSTGRAIPVQR